jgi:hypothetical protein
MHGFKEKRGYREDGEGRKTCNLHVSVGIQSIIIQDKKLLNQEARDNWRSAAQQDQVM